MLLDFVQGIDRSPVNSLHKRPVTRKMFPFDEFIVNVVFFSWQVSDTLLCRLVGRLYLFASSRLIEISRDVIIDLAKVVLYLWNAIMLLGLKECNACHSKLCASSEESVDMWNKNRYQCKWCQFAVVNRYIRHNVFLELYRHYCVYFTCDLLSISPFIHRSQRSSSNYS